jgi:hypothetical protein
MNVIGGHRVIEYAKAIALPGFKQPLEITATVSGKFQKKFFLVTPMSNMPDIALDVMPTCPWHLVFNPLKRHFHGQKHRAKPQNHTTLKNLFIDYNPLTWSGPGAKPEHNAEHQARRAAGAAPNHVPRDLKIAPMIATRGLVSGSNRSFAGVTGRVCVEWLETRRMVESTSSRHHSSVRA